MLLTYSSCFFFCLLQFFDFLRGLSVSPCDRPRRIATAAADLRFMLTHPVSHILPGAGGIMPGIPPDIPVLGPNRICLCCCSCCCSSCNLSVSNTTGSTRIMKEVVPTQSAEREKLYNFLASETEHCADTSAALRTVSGNISVRPHNLSISVSSKSSSSSSSISSSGGRVDTGPAAGESSSIPAMSRASPLLCVGLDLLCTRRTSRWKSRQSV